MIFAVSILCKGANHSLRFNFRHNEFVLQGTGCAAVQCKKGGSDTMEQWQINLACAALQAAYDM